MQILYWYVYMCIGYHLLQGIGFDHDSKTHKFSSQVDLLSREAFSVERVRNCALVHSNTITYWMPLYLNQVHAAHALPLFNDMIAQMYPHRAHDSMIKIEFLSQFMHSMIAHTIANRNHSSNEDKTIHCVKALEGYVYCQQWLNYFLQHDSLLQQQVVNKVRQSVDNSTTMAKQNLGIFYILLSHCSHDIPLSFMVLNAMVNELMDRSVRALPHPYIDMKRSVQPLERAKFLFKHAQCNVQQFCLHHAFAKRAMSMNGKATDAMRKTMRIETDKILQQVTTFTQFLHYLNIPVHGNDDIFRRISVSIARAKSKGYIL